MKKKTWIKKAVTVLLILAMCLGWFRGMVPDTARAAEQMGQPGMIPQKSRASANPDAVDAEIDVEKIDLPADFIEGVDVSSYDSLKNSGVKFYDFDGNELDYGGFFTLLKDSGVNYVRLRVWKNPFNADGHGYGGGNNSIENARKMGKAASDAGLKVLIDFHYSDFWADAGKQKAPEAWADYTVDQKADAIEEYTYDSLKELIEAGVDVGMVQIGNETNGNFCGESDWENCAKLFNAGATAARNVGSECGKDILVALHFTNPEQVGNYAGIAKELNDNGVDYDVFASSYYPDRHGTLENLKSVLSDVSAKYGKKVMVAETSWATTLEDGDGYGNTISGSSAGIDAYPVSVQGQADAVSAVIGTIADTTNGIGVFYQEPAWIPVQVYDPDAENAAEVLEQNKQLWEKHGSGWASSYVQDYDAEAAGRCGGSRVDNQAMFDFEGHPLDSLNVWKYVKTGAVLAPVLCSLDGGTTWTGCDSLENVLFNVSGYLLCKNPIIRLNKDITVDGAVSLLYNNNVLIDGQGHTITRGNTNTGYLFGDNGQAGTLTFKNVTIDGGAVWDDAENVKERQNSGLSAGGDAWLIYCTDAGTKVILDNGAILQNNHLNNSAYNGAAVMMESGSLTVKAGAVIRNNTAVGTSGNYGGGGGAVHIDSGASFTMEGGEIYGNYASLCGGAIVNEGSFTLTGGEIKNNNAPAGGGVYNNANMSVSGTAKIYNNSQGNVYLPGSKIINNDAPLSDGASIGVTTATAPTEGNPVNITGHNKGDYSQYFHSDNPDYEIVNANDYVQLVVKTPDTEPPTGKIEIEDHSWTGFLHAISFGLFFKETKQVTITAEDTDSGVDQIYYYISDSGMTEAQVKALGEDAWTEGGSFSIDPDRKCVIYAKITDQAGNVTYLSSDGLAFDGTAPVITGVTDGAAYDAPQTVTVTDAMSGVKSVTVDGVEVTLTNNQFTLGTADNPQTIVATDQAGNTAAVTVTVKTHTHDYGSWQKNDTQHWKTCSCGEEKDRASHEYGNWITDKEATAAEAGTKHRECQTCSYRQTGTIPATGIPTEKPVTPTEKPVTPTEKPAAPTEKPVTPTEKPATETEKPAAPTEKPVTPTEKPVTPTEKPAAPTEKPAAPTEKPVTPTEKPAAPTEKPAIPTEKPGTVTTDVESGENAPATNVSTPAEELKNMLLTNEEKKQVQAGTDIRIVLEVQDAGNTVGDSDKENIRKALNGFTVGQYLNIDLYKLAGDKRTDITETAKKIKLVITVPDSLKNANGSKTRTFAVIRVHDGKADLLTDMDDSTDTITIETDRFSTYAVVYQDQPNGGNSGGGTGGDNGGGDNGGSTGSSGNNNSNNNVNGNANNNGNQDSSSKDSGEKDSSEKDSSEKDHSGSSHGNDSDNSGDDRSDPGKKDNEPKTGEAAPLEVYATLAMIAGLSYVILYFKDRKRGMTEKRKKELVSGIIRWAKRGGTIRKYLAVSAIFGLLVYYHAARKVCRGTGEKMSAGWEEIYGK